MRTPASLHFFFSTRRRGKQTRQFILVASSQIFKLRSTLIGVGIHLDFKLNHLKGQENEANRVICGVIEEKGAGSIKRPLWVIVTGVDRSVRK